MADKFLCAVLGEASMNKHLACVSKPHLIIKNNAVAE